MPSSLNIDYRMGSAWGASEVNALLILLKELCGLGGTLVAPWWAPKASMSSLKLCVAPNKRIWTLPTSSEE